VETNTSYFVTKKHMPCEGLYVGRPVNVKFGALLHPTYTWITKDTIIKWMLVNTHRYRTKSLRCFSAQANYTDRATAACRRS
jgi:hypothetical protein